jgi:hypothetical protein
MRADSLGHCAKFGSYTMMDLRSKRIIDIQLVQVCMILGSLMPLNIYCISVFSVLHFVHFLFSPILRTFSMTVCTDV